MNRREDIRLIFEECDANISRIDAIYNSAKSDDQQMEVLKPIVKSTLEHLRSILEYSAQDIWESYTKKKNKPYFPYGKNTEFFQKSVKKNLPGLAEQRPDILSLIESIQPQAANESWLLNLCEYTNSNKHDRLKGQVRRDSPSNTISINNGDIVIRDSANVNIVEYIYNGMKINSAPMHISSTTPSQVLKGMVNEGVEIKKQHDWVEFHFEGSVHDVLALLKQSREEIELYILKLYTLI